MEMPHFEIEKLPKEYYCEKCRFKCCKKSNWETHLSTAKHKNIQNNTLSYIENAKRHECNCGRSYKHSSNYYTHRNKCKYEKPPEQDIISTPDTYLTNLVLEVVKNNTELQKQNIEIQKQNEEFKTILLEQNNKMIETVKEVCKNNTNNTNIINSNNKAFNLNVFLNETCKDAMDINDFIDSVKLQLSDLELVGKLGFVDGISSIIIKNLKALKMNERPVHCTDMKRETMYVKEQGIWEKQEGDYKNLRKVIKRIAFKNSKNLSLYKELHPDYNDYYSKHSDHYLKLQIEAFGGSGNETIDNENKIIKKIAKEMTIDKSL